MTGSIPSPSPPTGLDENVKSLAETKMESSCGLEGLEEINHCGN